MRMFVFWFTARSDASVDLHLLGICVDIATIRRNSQNLIL